MKKSMVIILVILAAAALFLFNEQGRSAPDYSSFSTQPSGCGLFFDTLQRMGYPVMPGFNPLCERADTKDVYIVIRPANPAVDEARAEAMLEWVRKGGRLIFLDNRFPTVMDRALRGSFYTEIGNLTHYPVGQGEVVTGRAQDIANIGLMLDQSYGRLLQQVLQNWDAERIWFAEYYHGYRPAENFYTRLPLTVKLTVFQLMIITLAVVWYAGKRFGKPIPFHEETEREENEHVKALARLYGRIK
jgi:hypothetical protein